MRRRKTKNSQVWRKDLNTPRESEKFDCSMMNAVNFFLTDLKEEPHKFVHTIFSGRELNEALNLGYEGLELTLFMEYLELNQIVFRTAKNGPDGVYFNVGLAIRCINFEKPPLYIMQGLESHEGYCCIFVKPRIHKICDAEKCPFFLQSTGRCIYNKAFL